MRGDVEISAAGTWGDIGVWSIWLDDRGVNGLSESVNYMEVDGMGKMIDIDVLKFMVDNAGGFAPETEFGVDILRMPKDGAYYYISAILREYDWDKNKSMWYSTYYPLLLTRACEGLGIEVTFDPEEGYGWEAVPPSGKGVIAWKQETADQAKEAGIIAYKKLQE